MKERLSAEKVATLISALEWIAENEFACDCEDQSWYGEDHHTLCPLRIAREALKKVGHRS